MRYKILKAIKILLFTTTGLFISCSGSDSYMGKWKGTNEKGDRFNILFASNELSINKLDGYATKIGYKQNSYSYSKGIVTYGIILDDGRKYDIRFPNPSDTTRALILEGQNANTLYIISRHEFIDQYELYRIEN